VANPFPTSKGRGWIFGTAAASVVYLLLGSTSWLTAEERSQGAVPTAGDGLVQLLLLIPFAGFILLGNILFLATQVQVARRERSWRPLATPVILIAVWFTVVYFNLRHM
jgi:hypothetical protein